MHGQGQQGNAETRLRLTGEVTATSFVHSNCNGHRIRCLPGGDRATDSSAPRGRPPANPP